MTAIAACTSCHLSALELSTAGHRDWCHFFSFPVQFFLVHRYGFMLSIVRKLHEKWECWKNVNLTGSSLEPSQDAVFVC